MSSRFGSGLLRATLLLSLLSASVFAACGGETASTDTALASIDAGGLSSRIEVLSSDAFEGRLPGSAGEQKTIDYLESQFRAIGLEPGNGDSFVQSVPLVSMTVDPGTTLKVSGQSGAAAYAYGDDFMVWTKRVIDRVDLVDSELVFVGYGIVAPEYGRDDYQGLDVTGKTVVMLVNDPGYTTGDPQVFNGRAMTYYGRWTYKYEEAARQGAAGALVIHETGPAGYPWDVVRGSWSGAQFDLVAEDANLSRVAVEGWLTEETASAILEAAGHDLGSLQTAAASPDFEPVPLGLTASIGLENEIERITSRNVLALLPGSERPEEIVVYMAHWDHLGKDESLEGDQIYNGALDNATGTAGLLELAEAFVALEDRPARSILFLSVTAEEFGLLGSRYYATNPVYPLPQTVAAINLDGMNIYGPMRDMTVVGRGMSELDGFLESVAETEARVLRPDPETEKGFYYRSDHFEFAKQGVPALYTDTGIDHIEFGEAWGIQRRDDYTAQRYHKPSDEYDPNWDLSGAIDDLEILFRVGHALASSTTFPNWNEGTEFRARRDSMMAGIDSGG